VSGFASLALRSPIWSRFAAENHLAGGRFARHPRDLP
jgi:hypothetical protein